MYIFFIFKTRKDQAVCYTLVNKKHPVTVRENNVKEETLCLVKQN